MHHRRTESSSPPWPLVTTITQLKNRNNFLTFNILSSKLYKLFDNVIKRASVKFHLSSCSNKKVIKSFESSTQRCDVFRSPLKSFSYAELSATRASFCSARRGHSVAGTRVCVRSASAKSFQPRNTQARTRTSEFRPRTVIEFAAAAASVCAKRAPSARGSGRERCTSTECYGECTRDLSHFRSFLNFFKIPTTPKNSCLS